MAVQDKRRISLRPKNLEPPIFSKRHEPKSIYDLTITYQQTKDIANWFNTLPTDPNKALFFTGPPGTGKTAAVKIFCDYYGYTIKEFNALDCRNKKLVDSVILNMLDHKPIDSHLYRDRKYVIVIDELECMADKNSLNEIIKLLNTKKRGNAVMSLPLIFISNETTEKKINELKKHCLEIKFPRPNDEILTRIFKEICAREKITIDKNDEMKIIQQVLQTVDNDYRRLIKFSEFLVGCLEGESKITLESVLNATTIYSGKNIDYDIYQNTVKLFTTGDLKESIRIYENDKSLLPMMVHENYTTLVSSKYSDKTTQLAKSLRIINYIIQGDLIDKVMYNTQSWHYYTVHCLNSCYLPVYHSWTLAKRPEIKFTTTLGKHSLQSSNKKKFLMVLSNIGNGKTYSTNDLYYLGNIIRYHALNKSGDIEEIKRLMRTYGLSFDIIDRIIRFSKLAEPNTVYSGKLKTSLKTSLQTVKVSKSLNVNFDDGD